MVFLGLDGSKNGTGAVIAKTDEFLNIQEFDYISFTQVKKNETEKIKFHHKDKSFNDDMAKLGWVQDEIDLFIGNFLAKYDLEKIDYAAIEDYSFNSPGFSYDKGEICGMLKSLAYKKYLSKLRKYSPKTIKKFAGTGKADKTKMCEFYIDHVEAGNLGLSLPLDLKTLEKQDDLIDAYWICKLLIREVSLKQGFVKPDELSKNEKELFAIRSKDNTKNYLYKKFDVYHTNLVGV
jgi:hypothetical protein